MNRDNRCQIRPRPGCPINQRREQLRRQRERDLHFLLFDYIEWAELAKGGQ